MVENLHYIVKKFHIVNLCPRFTVKSIYCTMYFQPFLFRNIRRQNISFHSRYRAWSESILVACCGQLHIIMWSCCIIGIVQRYTRLQATLIQLREKQTAHLIDKNYQNEITLTGQNPPLKCCQPLKILAHLTKGLDLFMIEIWGL